MKLADTRFPLVAILIAALLATVLMTAPAMAADSNKWRIQVSEGANSDGEIVFRFSPTGGTAVEVTVVVKDGTGENAVAKQIRDTFEAELDAALFAVEVDDGEDVLVKKRDGQPDFGLSVARNSVKGVRINLDTE